MPEIRLKKYIIQNRDDQEILSTYIERRANQAFPVIANIKGHDFDKKLNAAIVQTLGEV